MVNRMGLFWRVQLVASVICLAAHSSAQAGRAAGADPGVPAARDQVGWRTAEGGEDVPTCDRSQPPAAEETSSAVEVSAIYTGEILGTTRGGLERGSRYLDNLDVTLTIDGERALGWAGATLFAYLLYNNGEPFSDELLGAAQGVSNIETGVRAVRLYEAWVEQRFASGRASIKFGLYDLNSEFDAIETAALFLNPSHGIGPDFSQSGRAGPSIFPSTSIAVRGDYKLADRWLVRAAVLDGVPGDPDRPKRTAVKLSEADGALGVVELNYMDDRTKAALGYWRYTASFQPLSGRSSTGAPASQGGNDGVYAFVERKLTREADDAQGLAGWVRVGVADEQLNAIRRYAGAGLAYTGLLGGRPQDQVGLAVGVARFGEPFRRSAALAGHAPARDELIIEATYRAPLTPWLTLQPDIQYVVDPGGDREASDALVLGLRAEVGF